MTSLKGRGASFTRETPLLGAIPELDSMAFLKLVREKLKVLHLKDELLNRAVNEGFSGGEKKRNEIFQMAVLEPRLAILDETDSGLDIDALKLVSDGVNSQRRADRAFLVITHYQRLLDYIVPDRVHVLADGRIAASGDKDLALKLEAEGYAWLRERRAEEGERAVERDGVGVGDVDRDAAAAREGMHVDAVALSFEQQLKAVVRQAFGVQPLADWWWHLAAIRACTFPTEHLPDTLRAVYRPRGTA